MVLFVKIFVITFGVDSPMHNLNGRSLSAVSEMNQMGNRRQS